MRNRPYHLEAQDGADEDGGTLYTLFDERNDPVASCAWPHPLEALAFSRGFAVKRRHPILGAHGDRISAPTTHDRIVARILAIPPRPAEGENR